MGPPTDAPTGRTGPVDRQTLRLLETHLIDDPLVESTSIDPDPYEPRLLHASLDTGRYPESVETVRIDIQWFTSGDFSFHYLETESAGQHWECRWDRHPNEHNTRLHFHMPPTGTNVRDIPDLAEHPLEVYSTVLTAIDERIETLWSEGE
ncbi:hypothetical protein [Natronomonas gomsonensis]|uniref:hypothetical protein n=1 Tax=Natronomonas gomsonensis TaxID=1046043 RepID=UPI0032B17610